MSVANFGHSAGSKIYGVASEGSSYAQSYTILGAIFVVMIVVIMLHRHSQQDTKDRSGKPDNKKRERPRYTIGASGNEAGMFWSGAMRCPKCRADMEQIDYEGTEIDRCTICNGIWFDAGEIDVLGNSQAAAAIDTGDAEIGQQSDAIDSYQCPRCSGQMVQVVDPDRPHIRYETCGSCNGSYLDAGELSDIFRGA